MKYNYSLYTHFIIHLLKLNQNNNQSKVHLTKSYSVQSSLSMTGCTVTAMWFHHADNNVVQQSNSSPHSRRSLYSPVQHILRYKYLLLSPYEHIAR